MSNKNLIERISSIVTGFGIGITSRLLTNEHNSSTYISGALVALGAGGVIPIIKNKEKNERLICSGSSLAAYPAGYYVADYFLRNFY